VSEKVQLRLDSALAAKLHTRAKELGWTESQLVRYILEVSLGDDPRLAAITQIAWGVNAKLASRMSEVTKAINEALERILIDAE